MTTMIWIRKNSWVALLLLWSGLIYGTLQVHFLGHLANHSICGPWGCGPTSNTLLAVHLMWLAIVLPPAIFLQWRFSAREYWEYWMRLVSWMLMIGGVLGISSIMVWQWFVWLPAVGESLRPYIWQRCGFAVLTAVDWPWLQLIVTGLCVRIIDRFSFSFTGTEILGNEVG